MPSAKTTKFALLDTAIYCSSAVLHELLRGARTVTERKFVLELSRRCQVLTPTEQQWLKAAEILHRLRRREYYEAAKLRELAFDVLIALSARSIGASVITTNHADFPAIQREFEVKLPEDFPKHSPLAARNTAVVQLKLFIDPARSVLPSTL